MPEEIITKNETTNAVLKATIDGLAKLTDTQLGHVNETLKEMKTLMAGFATKAELEEVKRDFTASVKRIEDDFKKHNEDDKQSFGGLTAGQKEVRDTLIKWGAVFAAFLFVLSFLSPVILKYIFKV